jgi:pyruvate kinase
MNLSWGVKPCTMDNKTDTDSLFEGAVEQAVRLGVVKSGDIVVITAGIPIGCSGTTNMMKVHKVE